MSGFDTLAKGGVVNAEEPKVDIREKLQIRTAKERIGKRPWKMLVEGGSGCGKSDTIATVPEWYIDSGVDPDDILILVADLDDGLEPLFEQERTEYDLQDRIEIAVCTSFDDWLDTHEYFIDRLKRWKEDRGVMGMFAVDNLGKMWEWARSSYAEKSYGMSMRELLIQRRRMALEASKRTLPVFDQMVDYGVINPYHNDPLEKLKLMSNQYFHYLWTAPVKEYDGRLVTQGQWENEFRVDFTIHKYKDGEGADAKFYADLTKWRGQSRGFVRRQNPTFLRITNAIKHIRELEAQDRKVKSLSFKRPEPKDELKTPTAEVEEPVIVAVFDDGATTTIPNDGGVFGNLKNDMTKSVITPPKKEETPIEEPEGDLEW